MTWDPVEYPSMIRREVHHYEELQAEVARATAGAAAARILDLGTGAGETAGRVLRLHPGARLVGVDSSPEMLVGAAEALPPDRVSLLEQDLGAPLPQQGFDLVVSALAIHHLDGPGKAALFRRVADVLVAGGTFVMGDVVVPEDPADALIENEEGYDMPSPLVDQLQWLRDAGFAPEVVWERKDLAVVRSVLPA